MPVVPLTAETSARFRERLGGIGPDTPRQWGSLSPAGLMAHLTVFFEFSLGESEGQDISNALTRTRLMRWFIIHAMPWPRGKIKAPPWLKAGAASSKAAPIRSRSVASVFRTSPCAQRSRISKLDLIQRERLGFLRTLASFFI